MKKIYVIGAGENREKALQILKKKFIESGKTVEIVCVESEEDIPLSERFSSDPSKVQHIHEFKAPVFNPVVEPLYYYEKRKGHERPYKYHR